MNDESKTTAKKLEEIKEMVQTLDEDVMNLYQGLAGLFEKADDVESRFNRLEEIINELKRELSSGD